MTLDRLAEILYVDLPVRLRHRAPLLGTILADGLYLTAWPMWALLVPVFVFVFGFSVGGWHWLPHNIWDGGMNAHPAVAFMQMLPLLVITAAVGALSAGLGLVLVAGYALGDLFISGATYTPYFHRVGFGWWLGHVTTAQLVTYLVFLMLAVQPTLLARAFSASVPGLHTLASPAKRKLRALIAMVLVGVLVYAWTLMAPMAVRPLWIWVRGSTTPVTVQYFSSVVNPLLPLVAAGFMLVRSLIEALARDVMSARRNAVKLAIAYTQAQAQRAHTRRSGWPGAFIAALLVTLMLAGMITRIWPTGIVVFAAAITMFIAHRSILPRWSVWQAWTQLAERIPLILRWMVSSIGAYVIARGVLAMPGWSTWQNEAAGAFGVELFAIMLGLALAAMLFPTPARPVAVAAAGPRFSASGLAQILIPIAVVALVLHSEPALAYCVAPRCCLVNDALTALFIIASVGLLALIVCNPASLAALFLESVVEFALDSLMGLGRFLMESVATEVEEWIAKPGAKFVAALAESLYGTAMDKIGGWPAKLYHALSLGMGMREAGRRAVEKGMVAVGGQIFETAGIDQITERIEELPQIDEGLDVLRSGVTEVGNSIQQTVEGIENLMRPPGIAHYPLGGDGVGPAPTSLPASGVPTIAVSPHSATGRLFAADPGLPARADAPIGANAGLQSSHAAGFGDVRFGNPGTPDSHYVWASDGRGISITPGHGNAPGSGDPTATNAHATNSGRVWFGSDGTVTVQLDARGGLPATHDPEQLQAIVKLWQSLGYMVKILPVGG